MKTVMKCYSEQLVNVKCDFIQVKFSEPLDQNVNC